MRRISQSEAARACAHGIAVTPHGSRRREGAENKRDREQDERERAQKKKDPPAGKPTRTPDLGPPTLPPCTRAGRPPRAPRAPRVGAPRPQLAIYLCVICVVSRKK